MKELLMYGFKTIFQFRYAQILTMYNNENELMRINF